MIIVDYSQTVISNIMAEIGNKKDSKLEVNLLRHMVINTIRSHYKQFKDEYGSMTIACDSKKYWRKDFFPYYKGNRKKVRQESGHDWNLIFDTINMLKKELKHNFPWAVVEVEGAEADDIIATYVKYKHPNEPVMIVSGDHDFIQLQKYDNVKQWSPIKNKFVECVGDPKDILFEHIIKGDKGDGVPNVLTEDDAIVEGRRQKPIHSKKLEMWKKDHTQMPQDSSFVTNYERNQTLVDLSRIPNDIESEIQLAFVKAEPPFDMDMNKNILMDYFNQHKLNKMIESIEEFV
mgnify:FL=1|tara:strand:+ start:2050 stop:2919 length:870 start_codon:yes stop_codon:yes gene_type:complete